MTAHAILPASRADWRPIDHVVWVSWLLALALLPITSQPLLGSILGGRPVNPASLVPCMVVAIFGIAPFLLRGGAIPTPVVPLLVFVAAALLATVLSPWLGILPVGGLDFINRGVRGLATLAIGLTFFLAAVYLPSDEARLRTSLQVIAVGGVAAMIWASLQPLQYPAVPLRDTMDAIHEFLFSPRPLFRDRVTGMAVEPSWFADQLVLLYLPLWLGAILKRTSAFSRRWRFPWVESVLLLWGNVLLLLSASRSGYGAWGLVWVALAAVAGWWAATRAFRWYRKTRGDPRPVSVRANRVAGVSGAASALVLILVTGVLVAGVAARFDRRMAALFSMDVGEKVQADEPPWFTVADRLEYAERVIYWTSAGRVFALYPILGVGLGNSGFSFSEVVPALGYRLVDVVENLGASAGTFPNPKSLWFRLLGETGIVGFVLFVTWLGVMAAASWEVNRRGRGVGAAVGIGAILSLLAFLVEGLSLDTFALPYIWIILGMSAAGWWRTATPVPAR